jgi:hypothetical protein
VFRFDLNPSESFSIASFDGTLTDEDFLNAFTSKLVDTTRDLLVDLRGLTDFNVTRPTVGQAVNKFKPVAHERRRRVAVVAPSDIGFGVARMYEMMRPESNSPYQSLS